MSKNRNGSRPRPQDTEGLGTMNVARPIGAGGDVIGTLEAEPGAI